MAPELSTRTKSFALRIIQLVKSLPPSFEAKHIGHQILRSGTSVGAQYRESQRARSKVEFLAKLQASLQELEETGYWLELLLESGIAPKELLNPLYREQQELTAIFVTAVVHAKE